MRIFGLAGWSGSGKTTLLTKLIPELVGRGVKVSTIKHAHHEFDIDKPGKDSWLHRQAGAMEVMVASSGRFALMHELRDEPEPPAGRGDVDDAVRHGRRRQGAHGHAGRGDPQWRPGAGPRGGGSRAIRRHRCRERGELAVRVDRVAL